jgi:hypothetical protein
MNVNTESLKKNIFTWKLDICKATEKVIHVQKMYKDVYNYVYK